MLAEQLTIDKLIEDKKEHIKVLHSNSKGWITVADIENERFEQWHYKYKDVVQAVGGTNFYISQNTFYKTYRRVEYLKELKSLYIDLDIYNTEYTKESALYFLQNDYFNRSIPRPNLIIDSGRGLYLVWNIEVAPSMALPLWKAIEEYLYKQLKQFGADRKALDATRVLRIVGTKNSKSNTLVKIIDKYKYLYSLKEIQAEYLPELIPREKKKGRPRKVYFVYRERSLYQGRINDLVKICELREWDVEGHRELILFLYRYWLCCFTEDTEEAIRMALELNSQFIKPLPQRVVKKATESAEKCFKREDKQYKYKNETLIDLLDISLEEQKHLQIIISNKEKYRRNNTRRKEERRNEEGLTKREQLKQNKIQVAKELKEQGFNNNQIAQKLGLNRSTVGRYLK